MTEIKEIKPKKCKASGCGKPFKPSMTTQMVCSIACAKAMAKDPKLQKIAAKAITRQKRQELQERREKLKSRADYVREAQAVFNRWVRLRDEAQPCISCGRHHQASTTPGITARPLHALSCDSIRSMSTSSARPAIRSFRETSWHTALGLSAALAKSRLTGSKAS